MAKANNSALPPLDINRIKFWRTQGQYDATIGAFLLHDLEPQSSRVLKDHPFLAKTMEAIQQHPNYIKGRRTVPNARRTRFRFHGHQHSHTSDSSVDVTTNYLIFKELKRLARSLGLNPQIFDSGLRASNKQNKPLSPCPRNNLEEDRTGTLNDSHKKESRF